MPMLNEGDAAPHFSWKTDAGAEVSLAALRPRG